MSISEESLRAIESRWALGKLEDRDVTAMIDELRRLYRAQRKIYRSLNIEVEKLKSYQVFDPRRIVASAFERE